MKPGDRYRGLHFRCLALVLLVSVTACSEQERQDEDPVSHKAADIRENIDFAQVRPILEKRCVVCHACYDASCQLNLSTLEGIRRGASKTRVYDGTRLAAAQPTRLFIDADNVAEWRQRGFFSVLGDSGDSPPEHGLASSLLFKMLQLKQANPLPLEDDGRLQNEFDLSLSREWFCPDGDEFDDYAENHPHAGMPFALPAITNAETNLIEGWIAGGAKGQDPVPNLARFETAINRWERFFNRDSRRGQLASRYIFEHLYLGNLYFPEIDNSVFFKLVRSSTAPGNPVGRIASRRPFDDPGVERVYYRLLPERSHIVAKTHMPYALDEQRLKRFESLFFASDYEVGQLPSYSPEVASNPFITFRNIPARTRYRFMLEHSVFTIRGFMKGAVCRGQVALNVIDDHFWVFFASPDNESLDHFNDFLVDQAPNLSLPAQAESNTEPLLNWLEFSLNQRRYLAAKSRFLKRAIFDNAPLDQSYLWSGDGENPNAALTVFRHFDSASVRQGLLGKTPKTAWLIDYPILERIHYLLVAGFDVYGNIGHQLLTRMYMDFLRMESEFNFLTLLPERSRVETSEHWYRDAGEDVRDYVYGDHARIEREPDIDYKSDDRLAELHAILRRYLDPVLKDDSTLLVNKARLDDYRQLKTLQDVEGIAASFMPEMSVVMVGGDQPALFTVLRNSAHSNISGLFEEASRRLPEEDSLTLLPGVIGAYPDAYWKLETAQLPAFVQTVQSLRKPEDYFDLMGRFGIRRSNPNFWSHSDRVHQLFRADYPIEYGLLDYNRLENR